MRYPIAAHAQFKLRKQYITATSARKLMAANSNFQKINNSISLYTQQNLLHTYIYPHHRVNLSTQGRRNQFSAHHILVSREATLTQTFANTHIYTHTETHSDPENSVFPLRSLACADPIHARSRIDRCCTCPLSPLISPGYQRK